MYWGVETPWVPMHKRVTKVDLLKNPKWSYVLGSRDSLVSYVGTGELFSVSLNLQAHATDFKETLFQKNVMENFLDQ